MKPETEAKLNKLAEHMRRSKEEVLEQVLNQLFAYYELVHVSARRDEPSDQQSAADVEFKPVEIRGEPLSATVLRERR